MNAARYLLAQKRKPRRIRLGKNRAAETPVKAFNTFEPFKSLKALRAQKILAIPMCSLRKSSKDLKAALAQSREIGADLGIHLPTE